MVCAASRQHRVLNAPLGLVSAEEFRTGDSVRDKIRSMLLAAFTNLDGVSIAYLDGFVLSRLANVLLQMRMIECLLSCK